MPVLEKPRWEIFARNLARGMTQHKAYIEAGFAPGSPGNAQRLANNPLVVDRVKEIQEEREEILSGPTVSIEGEESENGLPFETVDMNWVIERLAANVQSAMTMGNHSAANKALEMLGHHLGMTFADKIKGGDPDNLPNGGGGGNTYNILQLTEALGEHAKRIENSQMKDISPPKDGSD
ncbi:MAG: hypothetical protein RIA09_15915 [Hoeflea sp.]|jgi:hypothetical protein|uniref:hypothetical protein n=1 Tax=Hoeflea sp. TaxID=1940281 RepID=UPI0032EE4679